MVMVTGTLKKEDLKEDLKAIDEGRKEEGANGYDSLELYRVDGSDRPENGSKHGRFHDEEAQRNILRHDESE